MPNHITNITKFIGEEEAVKRVMDSIAGENGEIDFNKIIPMPETILNTESSGSSDLNLAAFKFIQTGEISSELYRYVQYRIEDDEFGEYSKTDLGEVAPYFKVKEYVEKDIKDGKIDLEKGEISRTNLELYGYKNWYDWSVNIWGTKWNAYDICKLGPDSIEYDTAWSTPEGIIYELARQNPDVTIDHMWADEDLGTNTGIIIATGESAVIEYMDDYSERAYEIIQETKGYSNCIYLDQNRVMQHRDCDDCWGCVYGDDDGLYIPITKLRQVITKGGI